MDVTQLKSRESGSPRINQDRQRPAARLERARIATNTASSDTVTVAQQGKSPLESSTVARERLNQAISASNVATESVQRMSQILASLDGIVEQVASPRTTSERKKALEREAQELVTALKDTTKSAQTSNPTQPSGERSSTSKSLSDDELEELIRKSLQPVVPDEVKREVVLEDVNFSTADAIVSTRKQVERARTRVEQLRESVSQTIRELGRVADTLDIAMQNREAADSSVRDLDEALRLTSQAGDSIRSDPDSAFASLSGLSSKSLRRVLS